MTRWKRASAVGLVCTALSIGGDAPAQTTPSDADRPMDDASVLSLDTAPVQPTDDVRPVEDRGPPTSRPAGPIAYATLEQDGTVAAGSSNVLARFDARAERYEIEIAGVSYHYLRHATLVTPVASALVTCSTSSVVGRLVVVCHDDDGRPTPASFSFVTFAP